MKVLITGATGFVGKEVVKQLLANGAEVNVLTRNVAKAALKMGSQCRFFQWQDTSLLPPLEAFEGVDGVINLMGEGIADKRWDEEQKKKIYESRITGTASLVEVMEGLKDRPKVLVSTSAVGIYGDRANEEITETSSLADDFLANVCKDWEREASRALELGVRVVTIRTGVVLGRGGGALRKMLPPFKLGLGGKLGTGQQYMSWIHLNDLASMYIEGLKNPEMQGPYNATAPYPVTNEEFTKCLGKALKRPTFATVPAIALKFLFGEMSAVLLEGQKVLPVKFKEMKFRFQYPTLEKALKETAY